jgi:uncharacterized protein YqeY
MTLIEKVKADQITARKAHDSVKASLLTTLLGEATAIGKNDGNREVTDAEVVALVKKFMKGVDEFIIALSKNLDPSGVARSDELIKFDNLRIERAILEDYLPMQMSAEDVEAALKVAIGDVGANMGKVMNFMKVNYEGRYDGKMVSTILKTLL